MGFRQAAVILVAGAVLLAGCGMMEESATSAPPSSVSPSPDAAPPAEVTVEVEIRGGEVSPEPSVYRVDRGQTVTLNVTSDQADEVHLHGYDRAARVSPGKPATIRFTADQIGRFEVETHESGRQLLQFEVR